MTNVMSKAWEIAKEGQKNFGGKVKEYFAQALKIAWKIVKGAMDYAKQIKGLIDVTKAKPGALVGTEKQISWASEIRRKALSVLFNEVTTEEYEQVSMLPNGRNTIQAKSVKNIMQMMTTEKGIADHFDQMKNDNLPESRFESAVKSMNDLYDRFDRFAEIMTNTDATFWIDNRDNQQKNVSFNKFIKYVRTGEKLF